MRGCTYRNEIYAHSLHWLFRYFARERSRWFCHIVYYGRICGQWRSHKLESIKAICPNDVDGYVSPEPKAIMKYSKRDTHRIVSRDNSIPFEPNWFILAGSLTWPVTIDYQLTRVREGNKPRWVRNRFFPAGRFDRIWIFFGNCNYIYTVDGTIEIRLNSLHRIKLTLLTAIGELS